tara:strand:- start:14346 stop:15065 length:720 start_codon:yes stop_codon:yes gene_type:complete
MIDLSIIIPSHNEEGTAGLILQKLFSIDFGDIEFEVIFVDDGSTDKTDDVLDGVNLKFRKIQHATRKGKSAAVRSGLVKARGEYVITQDADLELEPSDIVTLYRHALNNNLDIVYGSRRLKEKQRSMQNKTVFYHGAVIVTKVANILYRADITDEPTCYKLLKRSLVNEMNLKEEQFAYCPEVTAKALRLGHSIEELPISYYPRTVAEGKKVRFKDGLHAIWVLVKYRVLPVKSWRKLN